MYLGPALCPSSPFWTPSVAFMSFPMMVTGFPASPQAAPALPYMQALPHSPFPCWRSSDPPIFTLRACIPIHGLNCQSTDNSQIPMTTQLSSERQTNVHWGFLQPKDSTKRSWDLYPRTQSPESVTAAYSLGLPVSNCVFPVSTFCYYFLTILESIASHHFYSFIMTHASLLPNLS